MSVQVNTYVIIGYKFEYSEFNERYKGDPGYDLISNIEDTAFEGINNKNGLTVLFDGMNGEYVIVGHVLEKTREDQHFNKVIEIDSSSKMSEMVTGLLNLYFKEDDYFLQEEIKTYVVSHYR